MAQKMKIAYCTNVRLPSERAHGHQIAEVADALIALGHSVTVFAPFRKNIVTQSYHDYYGAHEKVQMQHIGSFDPIASPLLPGVLGLFFLNWRLRRFYTTLRGFDVLYTRAEALLPALIKTGIPTILELHQTPKRNQAAFVRRCNQCALVACLTTEMRKVLRSWGVDETRMIVAGDAVTLERFNILPSKEEARSHLKIHTDRPVIGYIGRLKTLGQNKGVEELLLATSRLKTIQPIHLLIVGGPETDQHEYEKMAAALALTPDDVRFTGALPADQVPTALIACDILAMPFPDYPHYRTNMSPLKMFEYMAASRPIITSDLPTIRDVLSEETAFFCQPGDTASLTQSIQEVLADSTIAEKKAAAARTLVEEHTWEKRMDRILTSLPTS